MKGHFYSSTINVFGMIESYQYSSEKGIIHGDDLAWISSAIYADVTDTYIYVMFIDNTINDSQFKKTKDGQMKLEIIQNSLNTITARWIVFVSAGNLRLSSE